ncbi:MAG: hypothetical protein HY905_06115 [Deltaproteobacteria bacterium]|nr:hypothetical protein [Deltaproteobacteria bacterium]
MPKTVFWADSIDGPEAGGCRPAATGAAVAGTCGMPGAGAAGTAVPTIGGIPNTVFIARPAAGLGGAAEDPGAMGVPGAVGATDAGG